MSDEKVLDLDAIEARATAATPDLMAWVKASYPNAWMTETTEGVPVALFYGKSPKADAEFAAAARADVLVMAARVRELESALSTATQTERARCLGICRSRQRTRMEQSRRLRAEGSMDPSTWTYCKGSEAAACGDEIERGYTPSRAEPAWTPANGSSREAAMLLAQDLNRDDAEGIARVLFQLRVGVDPTLPPRGQKARRLAVVECLIAAQNEERRRG